MNKCGYSRIDTLYRLPAAFVNQMVSLQFMADGVEVELASVARDRNESYIQSIKNTLNRDKSWLSELH